MKTIDSTSPPILIVHGGKDKQVGIHQAYDLEEKLTAKSVLRNVLSTQMKVMCHDLQQ